MKHEAVGVMTLARIGFSYPYAAIYNAFVEANIPLKYRIGAFMEQNLCNLLEDALKDDPKYIVSCEYDCLFTADDIKQLLAIMRSDSSIDAVFAAQCPRGRVDQLMAAVRRTDGTCGVVGQQPAPIEADLLKCVAGHFGLTVLRAESLRNLPRPWLHGQPADNGKWEDRTGAGGKINPDISFWIKAEQAGWNVFLATKVRIGHLVEMVSWPDEVYHTQFQYIGDWQENGRPANIFGDKDNV